MAAPGESYFAAFPPKRKPYISHGLTFDKACAHHAENTFNASRIFVVVSKSISRTADFTGLQTALGDKIVGVRYGVASHTPWGDVLALAGELKAKNPDLIVTLGGGSITDAVKLARLFVANNVVDMGGIDALFEKCKADLTTADATATAASIAGVQPAKAAVINVPTTLSGGEFTPAAGATDLQTMLKRNLLHASMYADIVVLDPALTISTPERFWLSTGVRAVDHCVEGLYANLPGADPARSEDLANALRALLASLLRTKKDPLDRDARLRAQLALSTSTGAIFNGMGASHGIGHQLGPMGVGHGETSCVVLPFVMKYNWAHGDAKVRDSLGRVAAAFRDEPAVVEALGLKSADGDPGDLVAAFVEALGLPRSLGQFGIGAEMFDVLAENSMADPCVLVNPVVLDKEKVIEILRMAA
ncbi:hypothetical protein AAE478_007960 [Parahypoxylon ruwenzoriense]